MNIPMLTILRSWKFINRFTKNIKYSSESFFSNWNIYRSASINSVHTSDKSIGTAHSYTASVIVSYMLKNLNNYLLISILNIKCIKDFRKLSLIKANINNRSYNLYYFSDIFFICQVNLPRSPYVALCLCTRNNFGNFLSNCALSCTIIFYTQLVHHVFCIFRCTIHSVSSR